MLRTVGLTRVHRLGGREIRALDGVDLAVADGEYLRIVGASGSGKSTLLNLLAGLDTPTAGSVETPLGALGDMTRAGLAEWRARHVGMVFQSFNLIPHRTALGNVELALVFLGVARRERRRRAGDALAEVGLAERLDHRPADLSGGEQQRVALARALVKRPSLLLADEPTGNLDRDSTAEIARLLAERNATGTAVLLVTHDPDLALSQAHRTVRLHYGRISGESLHRDRPGAGERQ